MACDMMSIASPPRRGSGTVVPFPTERREREALREDEPRGEILLFLGVRYERMPEPEAPPAPRRRRRS